MGDVHFKAEDRVHDIRTAFKLTSCGVICSLGCEAIDAWRRISERCTQMTTSIMSVACLGLPRRLIGVEVCRDRDKARASVV
jgi:hypothetical protein